MLAYIYIPIIPKELDTFRTTVWNHKRGRKQANKELPTGIPDYIHANPEEYECEDWGIVVSEENLVTTAEDTGVLDNFGNFLADEVMEEFRQIIPDVLEIESKDAVNAFIYLKQELSRV